MVSAMCGNCSLIVTIGELQNRFEFDGERLGYAPGYGTVPTHLKPLTRRDQVHILWWH